MTSPRSIAHALEGRLLLTHPFYRRWEAGELRDGELAAYGAQYEHFERQLPHTLEAIVGASPTGRVRDAIAATLDDELHRPLPHVELLDGFLSAVGSVPTPPSRATASLVELYEAAPARSVAYGVGVVAAYEVQAAAIARTKADGLRAHYALTDAATRFWDVHAALESEHADWTTDAADALPSAQVLAGVADSADAWWSFLDERDAEVAVSR